MRELLPCLLELAAGQVHLARPVVVPQWTVVQRAQFSLQPSKLFFKLYFPIELNTPLLSPELRLGGASQGQLLVPVTSRYPPGAVADHDQGLGHESDARAGTHSEEQIQVAGVPEELVITVELS